MVSCGSNRRDSFICRVELVIGQAIDPILPINRLIHGLLVTSLTWLVSATANEKKCTYGRERNLICDSL